MPAHLCLYTVLILAPSSSSSLALLVSFPIFTFSTVIHQSENSHSQKIHEILECKLLLFSRVWQTHIPTTQCVYARIDVSKCVLFVCDYYTRDLNLLKLNLCERSAAAAAHIAQLLQFRM